MGFIYNLIRKVFEWALFLALVGGLGEATTTMYREASRATTQGLVSLAARMAGLPYTATHVLRHGWTREIYNRNPDLDTAKQLLGDTSDDAARVYARRQDEYLKSIYVNWEILPVGQRDAVIARFLSAVKGKKEAIQTKLGSRYDLLASLGPVEFILGTNGFRRYFGARFGKDLVVFENIDYGNAVYVMFQNWEKLSKLSRVQLLSQKPDGFIRIVHKKGWKRELRDVIKKHLPPEAA